jgi:hypothetical protein
MKYLKTYESFNKKANCISYVLKNQSVTDEHAYRKDELEAMSDAELEVLCDRVRSFKALVGAHYNFAPMRPNQHTMGL